MTRSTRRAIKTSALAAAAVLSITLPAPAGSVEAVYLGTIRSGLLAPTSLAASTDEVAALEPYSKQLVVFTPNGTAINRIDITGDVRGLVRLSTTAYAFCDRARGQLTAIDMTTGRQSAFVGSLNDPVDVAMEGTLCHILDAGSRRIISADAQGHVIGVLDLASQPGVSIGAPSNLAFDSVRGAFHVFDQIASRAYVFASDGHYLGSYCSFGNEGGTITRGGGLACDADGYVYIVDRYQGRIAVFDSQWSFVVDIDAGALAGEPLIVPTGIAVDAQGTIYVASTEGDCIHVFFLDKTAVPQGDLAAAPLFPSPSGTLPAGDVKLVARIAALAGDISVLSADFRVARADAPEAPVGEATGVVADQLGVDSEGRLVGTATWRPDVVFEPQTVYQWQTRARAESRVGSWSEPITFSTRPATIEYDLEPNYPNPFNPQTTIAFTVPSAQDAVVEIYDLTGVLVWSKTFDNVAAGRHTVGWDGRNTWGESVASGVYFYRLRTAGFKQTRKMVLIR